MVHTAENMFISPLNSRMAHLKCPWHLELLQSAIVSLQEFVYLSLIVVPCNLQHVCLI